jgi:hypothetical protein
MTEPLFSGFCIVMIKNTTPEGGEWGEWGGGRGRKVTPYQSRVLAPHHPYQPPLAAETWTKISQFCRVTVENATFHLKLYTDALGYIRKEADINAEYRSK